MLGLPFATDGARIAVLLVRLGALPYGHADGRLSVPGAGLVSAVTHYGDPSTVLAPGGRGVLPVHGGARARPRRHRDVDRGRLPGVRHPAGPSRLGGRWSGSKHPAAVRVRLRRGPRWAAGRPVGVRAATNARVASGPPPRRPAFRSYSCLGEERERARLTRASLHCSGSGVWIAAATTSGVS